MSKFAIFVALVILTMPAASAQEAPVPLLRAPVSAQSLATTTGITEQGRSTTYVPADRLKLLVRTFGAAAGTVQSPTAMADAEKSVIDAMKANGISDAHGVTAVLGPVTSNDQIAGTILKPTHEKVVDIESRIIGALPPAITPALRNTNVTGTLEADSCAAAVERARSGAYADALKRAESLAAVAGVHIGALLAATEVDQAPGCADQGPVQPLFLNNGNDMLNDANIAVTAYVTAIFAIRP